MTVFDLAFIRVLDSSVVLVRRTPDLGPETITETYLDLIGLFSPAAMHCGRDMAGLFVKQNIGDMMQIISILTVLDQLYFAVASLERDTGAIASLDFKLLTTATKVEAVLNSEREAKLAKEVTKLSASAT